MKKYYLLFVVILLVPSFAYASWWNPFSWNWFGYSENSAPQTQIAPNNASLKLDAKDLSTTQYETPTKPTPEKKQSPTKQQDVVKQTRQAEQPTPNSTFCNGKYWNDCASGNKFICPTGGDAFCQASPPITPPTPTASWADIENQNFLPYLQRGTLSITLTNSLGEQHYYRLENGAYIQKSTHAEALQQFVATMVCNGIAYSLCASGSDFVCPNNSGGAYCRPQQQTQGWATQQQAANQQLLQCESQIPELKSQLLKLQNEVAAIDSRAMGLPQVMIQTLSQQELAIEANMQMIYSACRSQQTVATYPTLPPPLPLQPRRTPCSNQGIDSGGIDVGGIDTGGIDIGGISGTPPCFLVP